MPMRPKTNVPVEACRFAADVKLDPKGENNNVPFTAMARTAEPVPHWYWGPRTIHDMAGMKSASRFAVDFLHDQSEALGYCDSQSVTPDGLVCSGALTPFRDDDRANEIIEKSARGVPYQLSIDFDEWALVVEDVPVGMTAEVNGKTWDGPLTIFREWNLQGLAFCLHGIDSNTSVTFSNLSGKTVAVTRFSKGQEMTDSATTSAETATEEAHSTKSEATTTEQTAVGSATSTTTTETTETKPTETTQLSRKDEGKRFLDAYGEHGATLFAQGFSFEEAALEHGKILRAQVKQLQGQLSKQESGGTKPASFGGSNNSPLPAKFANLGRNIGRFAAGIKLPGQPPTTT